MGKIKDLAIAREEAARLLDNGAWPYANENGTYADAVASVVREYRLDQKHNSQLKPDAVRELMHGCARLYILNHLSEFTIDTL